MGKMVTLYLNDENIEQLTELSEKKGSKSAAARYLIDKGITNGGDTTEFYIQRLTNMLQEIQTQINTIKENLTWDVNNAKD